MNAWQTRSKDLAAFFMETHVMRNDAWGKYDKIRGAITAKTPLTPTVLGRHFAGIEQCGLHPIGLDNKCRWAAWDIDLHGDDPDGSIAAKNLAMALRLYDKLGTMGFYPLLYESNGKGGYHCRVYFDAKVPAWDVHAWARKVCNNAIEFFPMQASIVTDPGATKGCYGNYIRLLGRHHKRREFWSRVWDGGSWCSDDDAVHLILGWDESESDLISRGKPPAPPEHEPIDLDAINISDDERLVHVKLELAARRGVMEGGRTQKAFAFAAWLINDMAIAIDEAMPFLHLFDQKNFPPISASYPDGELRRIAENAQRYGTKTRGSGLAELDSVQCEADEFALEQDWCGSAFDYQHEVSALCQ